jgi:hypothetical protein
MYRRLLKALNALGAIGFMGSLAACLVLVSGLLAIAASDAYKNSGRA